MKLNLKKGVLQTFLKIQRVGKMQSVMKMLGYISSLLLVAFIKTCECTDFMSFNGNERRLGLTEIHVFVLQGDLFVIINPCHIRG